MIAVPDQVYGFALRVATKGAAPEGWKKLAEPRMESELLIGRTHPFRLVVREGSPATVVVFGDAVDGWDPESLPAEWDDPVTVLAWADVLFHRYCAVVIRGEALWLAVDHAALQPLFYRRTADGLAVAPTAAGVLRADGRGLVPRAADGDRPLPGAGESNFVEVASVPPGALVRLARDGAEGGGPEATWRWTLPAAAREWTLDRAVTLVRDSLAGATQRALGGVATAAATLSGGVDSATVAVFARPFVRRLATFTVGTAEVNEFAEARAAARFLGSTHTELLIGAGDVERLLPSLIADFETWDALTLQIAMPVAFLYEQVGPENPLFLTGYGSDLLFGGILDLTAGEAEVEASLLAQVATTPPTNELNPVFAHARGVTVRYPFWTTNVMQVALSIPGRFKTLGGREKAVLRRAMTPLLPEAVAWRCKLGIHQGSAMESLFAKVLGVGGLEAQTRRLRTIGERIFGRP